MQQFQFNQTDDDGSVTKQIAVPDEATWPRVVASFAEFLSAVYGFDIKGKLAARVGDEYVTLRQHALNEALAEGY